MAGWWLGLLRGWQWKGVDMSCCPPWPSPRAALALGAAALCPAGCRQSPHLSLKAAGLHPQVLAAGGNAVGFTLQCDLPSVKPPVRPDPPVRLLVLRVSPQSSKGHSSRRGSGALALHQAEGGATQVQVLEPPHQGQHAGGGTGSGGTPPVRAGKG